MAIRIPKVITGKWVARLIHRSKLGWTTGTLHSEHTDDYCALGIIGKEAGLSPQQVEGMGNHGGAAVITINDGQKTREEVIKAFCAVGDKPLAIDGWIDRLRTKLRSKRAQKGR